MEIIKKIQGLCHLGKPWRFSKSYHADSREGEELEPAKGLFATPQIWSHDSAEKGFRLGESIPISWAHLDDLENTFLKTAKPNCVFKPPWEDEAKASNGSTVREKFNNWFGNSHVMDNVALPKAFYHGTHRADGVIDIFDTECGEIGSHFGSPSQANQFVFDQEGAIYPVYLSIQNPLRLKDLGSFSGDGDEVYQQLDELGINEPKTPGLTGNDYLRARILDAGYDGVVYLNRREGAHNPFGPDGVDGDELNSMSDDEVMEIFPLAEDSWIAMHPGQIKSAIANSGLYQKDCASMSDSIPMSIQLAFKDKDSELVSRALDASKEVKKSTSKKLNSSKLSK